MPSIDSLRASDGTENAAVATIQSVRSAGATTLVVDTVQGINDTFHGTMGTPHTFVDPVTSETITVISEDTAVDFKGHVDGTNLEIDEIAPGYTDNGSAADDIVIIKPTTQWADELADLLAVSMEDDGSLKAVVESPGWTETIYQPDTVTYNGNRSYDLVFNGVDLTSFLDNGMRLKFDRTVTPPTQCTDLESSSSQSWTRASGSLTGISFTDDYTISAWIKLESYTGTTQMIFGRLNGSTAGFALGITAEGQLASFNYRIASNNRTATTYQSIPLNKWVHVAATVDLSGSSILTYIDGVSVPNSVTTNGTITAIVQPSSTLFVGARYDSSDLYFDGKIAQVALFDAVLSASTIKSYASQTLAGNETNCIGLWTFDGDGDDSNANANNLTAQASATATTTDSPFNATEYGIVTANSFSTNTTLTVQVPEGYAIPTSGGVSSVYYSTQDVPYGFPRDKGKWAVEWLYYNESSRTTSVNTWGALTGINFSVPIGSWKLGFIGSTFQANSSAGIFAPYLAVSTSSSTVSNYKLVSHRVSRTSSTTSDRDWVNMSDSVSLSSATTHYALMTSGSGGGIITVGMYGIIDSGNTIFVCSRFYAECAYV